MDEQSTQELRGTAFASNLRRAFGGPVQEDMPSTFATLLVRLAEVEPPSQRRPPHSHRLGM